MQKTCPNCGLKVTSSWNFCPRCGFSLKDVPSNKAFIEVDINKVMKEMIPSLSAAIGSMLGQAPVERSYENHDHNEILSRWGALSNEVVEPEDVVSFENGSTIHSIKLPDVKSKFDISIQKFENSFEIRAIGSEKRYLKIIRRNKGTVIASEGFDSGDLRIVIERRKM